jgi:hypothetical protein
MVWKLDGDTALWDRDGVQLKAPLGHIQRGLEWSMDGREESKSRLFQIDLRDVPPPRLADAYVRGDDVVVFYPEWRFGSVSKRNFWSAILQYRSASDRSRLASEAPPAILERH